MSQASCSRSAAIRALKKNKGDIVNAIMVCFIIASSFSKYLMLFEGVDDVISKSVPSINRSNLLYFVTEFICFIIKAQEPLIQEELDLCHHTFMEMLR